MNDKMLYVEQHILDPKTFMPIGSYTKQFTSLREFNSFYKLAKTDPYVIINILKYNPQENPVQKTSYDVMLYGMNKEIEI